MYMYVHIVLWHLKLNTAVLDQPVLYSNPFLFSGYWYIVQFFSKWGKNQLYSLYRALKRYKNLQTQEGHVAAQMVEAMRYKQEDTGCNS